jgi:uncharacterized repeat protein (TIGR03837 family)
MLKRWDIFCKIVDNFGDIGVCWRLARQLRLEHGLQIRLWIDDLEASQKIIPSLNVDANSQVCEEITILKWHQGANFSQAAEVVIEAFACGLPPAYLAAMVIQKSKWVNLEYLSAEPWVDDFHAKPSPQTNGLIRHFYFPSFTEKTGGLIREVDIAASTQNYPSSSFPRKRESILNKNSRWIPAFAGMTEAEELECTLKISLFCYPNAPIHDLLTAMAESNQRMNCYLPASSILPQIADFFGKETIDVGDYFTRDNLHVHILPFLSQADYDALLRDCDLNFVRGEDSWVRAIWAGKPFIWQPYFQDENTHIKKLEAFLDLFYADFNVKEMVCEAHQAWVAGQFSNEIWQSYLDNLSTINTFTCKQSKQLAKLDDLAAKLVIFCNKI